MTEATATEAPKRDRKPLTEGSLLNRVCKTAGRLSPEGRKALKAFLDVDSTKILS